MIPPISSYLHSHTRKFSWWRSLRNLTISFLLLFCSLYFLGTNSWVIRHFILPTVSTFLDYEIRANAVDLSFVNGVCVLDGLNIIAKDHSFQFTGEKFKIAFDRGFLWQDTPHFHEVCGVAPHLLLRQLSPNSAKKHSVEYDTLYTEVSRLPLSLDFFHINGGIVTYADSEGKHFEVKGIEGDIHNMSSLNFSGTTHVFRDSGVAIPEFYFKAKGARTPSDSSVNFNLNFEVAASDSPTTPLAKDWAFTGESNFYITRDAFHLESLNVLGKQCDSPVNIALEGCWNWNADTAYFRYGIHHFSPLLPFYLFGVHTDALNFTKSYVNYSGAITAQDSEWTYSGDLKLCDFSECNPIDSALASLTLSHIITYDPKDEAVSLPFLAIDLWVDTHRAIHGMHDALLTYNLRTQQVQFEIDSGERIEFDVNHFKMARFNHYLSLFNLDRDFAFNSGLMSLNFHATSTMIESLMIDGDFSLEECSVYSPILPLKITNFYTHYTAEVFSNMDLIFALDSLRFLDGKTALLSGGGDCRYDAATNKFSGRIEGKSNPLELSSAILDTNVALIFDREGIHYPSTAEIQTRMNFESKDGKISIPSLNAELYEKDTVYLDFQASTFFQQNAYHCQSHLRANAPFVFRLFPRSFFKPVAHQLISEYFDNRELNLQSSYTLFSDTAPRVDTCIFAIRDLTDSPTLALNFSLDTPTFISLDTIPLMAVTMHGADKIKYIPGFIDEHSRFVYEDCLVVAEETIGDFYAHLTFDFANDYFYLDSATALTREETSLYPHAMDVRLGKQVAFHILDSDVMLSDLVLDIVAHKPIKLARAFLPDEISKRLHNGMFHGRVQLVYNDVDDFITIKGLTEFLSTQMGTPQNLSKPFTLLHQGDYFIDINRNQLSITNATIHGGIISSDNTDRNPSDIHSTLAVDVDFSTDSTFHNYALDISSLNENALDVLSSFFDLPHLLNRLDLVGQLRLHFRDESLHRCSTDFQISNLQLAQVKGVPVTFMVNQRANMELKDSTFIIHSAAFEVNEAKTKDSVIALNATGHLSVPLNCARSSLSLDASYLNLPILSQIVQEIPMDTANKSDGFGLDEELPPLECKDIGFDLDLNIRDVELANDQHAGVKGELKLDQGILWVKQLFMNLNDSLLSFYGQADLAAEDGYRYYFRLAAPEVQLEPFTRLFESRPMHAKLSDFDCAIRGRGLSKTAMARNFELKMSCGIEDMRIPFYTDNLWVKLFSLPLSLITVESPLYYFNMPDTGYLSFEKGAMLVTASQDRIHFNYLRFWGGTPMREISMKGDVGLTNGEFHRFFIQLRTTAIMVFTFATHGTLSDPSFSLIQSVGSTMVEGTLTILDPTNIFKFVNPWETIESFDLQKLKHSVPDLSPTLPPHTIKLPPPEPVKY